VKYHLTSIFSKLSAGNRTEAVRIGVKLGIITL
jgi:DNA-binding CsgD family transcriptional regulator